MNIKRPKNRYLEKEQAKFMSQNDADVAARNNLLSEVRRRDLKTKGELIDFAKQNGYLKTPRDRDVLNDVLRKSRLPDDHVYDRLRRASEKKMKIATNKIMRAATK